MTAKPVKIAFEGDESDLVRAFDKAGTSLDGFAADTKAAGAKAESALAGVGDKADALGGASSQAAGGLGDLGGAMSLMPGPLGAIGAGMEAAAPAIMGVTGAADLLNLATTKFPILAKAQTVATNIMAGAQAALNAVMAGNPIALVIIALVALVAIFVIAYKKSETFREIVDASWAAIKSATKEVFEWVADKIATVFGVLKNIFLNFTGPGLLIKHWDDIKTNTREAFEAVRSAIDTKFDAVKGIFTSLRTKAADEIGSYTSDGGGVLGKLHSMVDTIGDMPGKITSKAAGMWDGIGDSFKGTINSMIGWWNDLSFSVDIPDKIPGLPDSFTISTPNIPMLASGGIVNKATLAVIGEAGPEAVIPLDRLRMLGGGGNVYQITVEVPVGASPEDVGRTLVAYINAFERSGGRRAA